MDDEFEDALLELFGDRDDESKKLGRLLLMLALDSSFSSPILVKHRLGYDTDWTYNCFRRLKRAGIMYGDKRKVIEEWKDKKTGTIAFILDTLVGLGEVKKLRDGRYCHKDWKPKKPMTCEHCRLKDDEVSYNYCKTDLRLARRSNVHIRVGTKHSWTAKTLRGGIEVVELPANRQRKAPKVDAIRVSSPQKRPRVGEIESKRPVDARSYEVATGILVAEKPKPDMEKLLAWWDKKSPHVS